MNDSRADARPFWLVSFHPMIVGHENHLVAGREPDALEIESLDRADALVVPQGVSERFYRLARSKVAHIFPNYDTRFDYPHKTGQSRLFADLNVARPPTLAFSRIAEYEIMRQQQPEPFAFPWVVKSDWGGEGDTVWAVLDQPDLDRVLDRLRAFESTGQAGFVIQPFVECGGRSLRVVVVGTTRISYWRVALPGRPLVTSVAKGATIDHDSDPEQQADGVAAVSALCRATGIDLAGFDLIFDTSDPDTPLFLEINYFFGRRGLGGSAGYYRLLEDEVMTWARQVEHKTAARGAVPNDQHGKG